MIWNVGDNITREQAQDLAIREAEKAIGFVSPNPLVGCVVVDKDHKFLSSGYHEKFGEAHAEINALNKLQKSQLQDATLYVTLEPCSHTGKTPPCSERLMAEPIKNVVIGLQDPNPLVAGRGISMLRQKGINVEVDDKFGERCRQLTEIFLWHIQNQSPFIALKVATSLDGKVALSSGESQWITGEEARKAGRALRAKYDATLIGAGTLIHDNPRMDFRGTAFEGKKTNRLIIWDPSRTAKEFLPKSIVGQSFSKDMVTLIHTPVITMEVLKKLHREGIYSILVEGGANTHSHFVQQGFVHKIYNFVAPTLLGPGKGWTETLKITKLNDKIQLNFTEMRPVGGDILLTAYPQKGTK